MIWTNGVHHMIFQESFWMHFYQRLCQQKEKKLIWWSRLIWFQLWPGRSIEQKNKWPTWQKYEVNEPLQIIIIGILLSRLKVFWSKSLLIYSIVELIFLLLYQMNLRVLITWSGPYGKNTKTFWEFVCCLSERSGMMIVLSRLKVFWFQLLFLIISWTKQNCTATHSGSPWPT